MGLLASLLSKQQSLQIKSTVYVRSVWKPVMLVSVMPFHSLKIVLGTPDFIGGLCDFSKSTALCSPM